MNDWERELLCVLAVIVLNLADAGDFPLSEGKRQASVKIAVKLALGIMATHPELHDAVSRHPDLFGGPTQ